MPQWIEMARSPEYSPKAIGQELAFLQNDFRELLSDLGDVAFVDKIEKAMLGETIIMGGYIRTELIAANSIVSNKIASNAIAARHIQAGAITADKINVQSLSAISANLGTITGGSLNIGNGAFKVSSAGKLEATGADISGRVTANNVTIDENGLTVDNGALIIRDASNTAIITPDGLKVVYTFTSSGEYNGWQMVGINGLQPISKSYEASIAIYIPEKVVITNALLYTYSAPAYLTGHDVIDRDVPDGLYQPKNLALYIKDFDNAVLHWPAESEYGMFFGGEGIEISTPVWGGRWSPTDGPLQTRIGNVTNYITPGQRTVFAVRSVDEPIWDNRAKFGVMKFDLIVEGFLRG